MSIHNKPTSPDRLGGDNFGAVSFGSFRSVKNRSLVHEPPKDERCHFAIEFGDACNLACAHCIYDASLRRRPVPDTLLESRLAEFLIHKWPTYITFAGKEPSLFIKAKPKVFRRIAETVKNQDTVRILMTNGLLLEEQQALLYDTIDCLDVSLDGDEASHDRNRGKSGAFQKTMRGIRAIAPFMKEVGVIATATSNSHTSTLNGIVQLQRLMAETFEPNGHVGLSLSLYYDRPGHPHLLSERELIALFKQLQGGPFPVRVLWTANYAHKSDVVFQAIDLHVTDFKYDPLTGLPLATSGAIELIAFNLLDTPTTTLRIATDGHVYNGCNYLTYGKSANTSAIGNITHETLESIYKRIQKTPTTNIPPVCRDRVCTKLCRGGDLLTASLEQMEHDPYCPKLL